METSLSILHLHLARLNVLLMPTACVLCANANFKADASAKANANVDAKADGALGQCTSLGFNLKFLHIAPFKE